MWIDSMQAYGRGGVAAPELWPYPSPQGGSGSMRARPVLNLHSPQTPQPSGAPSSASQPLFIIYLFHIYSSPVTSPAVTHTYIQRHFPCSFCFVLPLMKTTAWLSKCLPIIIQFWLVKFGNNVGDLTWALEVLRLVELNFSLFLYLYFYNFSDPEHLMH